jgi:hypothetical protein
MTITSFYGINLPVWVSDIVQHEKRHIKVLFLKRFIEIYKIGQKNGSNRTGKSGMVRIKAWENNS